MGLWEDALISLIIVLPLIVWLWSGTINPAFEDALRASARFNAQEIASVINVLQASPEGTEHKYSLPALNCTVKIDSRVNVTIQERITHITDYIHSPVAVEPGKFECSDRKERTLAFYRSRNRISASCNEGSKPC